MYEMVARRKPFEGETENDTMAAILKTEPVPLRHLVPETPTELARIVTKSLRKDREERYQVVKDLWLDLKALKQELEFQAKLDGSFPADNIDLVDQASAPEQRPHSTETRSTINTIAESLSFEIKRHKFGAVVVLAIVWVAIAAASFGVYKLVTRKPPVGPFQNIGLTRLTNSGDAIDATISPDGKYLVYVRSDRNRQSLWIRQVSTANDKEIVPESPVGFFGITFSPDGNDLYYALKTTQDAGVLNRIPVLGGLPVKVLEKIDGPRAVAPVR